jgi:predicted LPLAT superfamily acyltransferase
VKPAWLQQRERGSIFGLRVGVVIAFFLGRKLTRLILFPVCLYFLLFSVKSRRASHEYLSRVLPHAPRFGDLFRHYLTFATVALDRFFLLNNRNELYDIEVHGAEILQQTLDGGQGCLLLGAHLGSFEVLRAAGTAHELKIAMVMYEDNARNINTVAKDVDPEARSRIIELGRLDSMFRVYERLQQDAWVGMLADRILPGGEQMPADFLGGTASFPTAPYRIALMLRRPVLFMTGLYRGGNRYELHFEKLFDAQAVRRTARVAAAAQALQQYAQRLEHFCRIAPYNWFNFYDFWHTGAPQDTPIHGDYVARLTRAGFPAKAHDAQAGDHLAVDQPALDPPSYRN